MLNKQKIVVTHVSTDTTKRTATFDVDGTSVTRAIADGIGVDTLKDHLMALARGLEIERLKELSTQPDLV